MWLLGPGHRVGRPVALRQTVREQERVRESALRGRLILTPTPHRPPGGSGRQGGRGCQQFREQLYNPTSVGDVISSKPVGCLRLPASHAHSVQSRRLGALRAEGNNSWCRQMMSSLNGFLPAMLDTSVFETGLINIRQRGFIRTSNQRIHKNIRKAWLQLRGPPAGGRLKHAHNRAAPVEVRAMEWEVAVASKLGSRELLLPTSTV